MIIDENNNHLAHYGILRRSGRYPWGSGGDVETRSRDFLGVVQDLRRKGMTDPEIARGFDMTTTDLRALNSIAKNASLQADISMARRLKEKGYSNVEIGRRMNRPESTIRAWQAPGQQEKTDILQITADMLKDQVDKKGFIDVGVGTEHQVGVSGTKLNTAVAMLKQQGYEVHKIKVDQLGTGHKTEIKVLTPPGTTQKDVWKNQDKIHQITAYTTTGGRAYSDTLPPLSVDSKRIKVRYKEEGGDDADGVIYVRPGVEDLSLGGNRYAQVRIAVDGTHYLKGMAMYHDNIPNGADLVFNTNKSNTGNKLDAMKEFKTDKEGSVDQENPFGSVIRQIGERDTSGNLLKVTSAMNLVNDEGDWEKWSKNLSSQMLSKQSPALAKTQLNMTYERRQKELDEIMSLTNPVVRKKLLQAYADSVDSAAVHLKAAPLPYQKTHVLLPINSMKETEVYAPNYDNGERVVLIRFPHGGKFEIPELTVNNRNPEAKKLLGNAPNAVGINHKVAQRLSGADFDGDTVLVIPNNKRLIKTERPLEGLRNFDPQVYKLPNDAPKMSAKTKGLQMGKVSNLITDMTIRGASNDELARAVRHSMVVIDAEKHHLDYKRSAIENGIPALMEKYQDKKEGGASTLISRARSEERVPERKSNFKIDPDTGKKISQLTGAAYVERKLNKRTGQVIEKVVPRTTKSVKLAETDDAHTLSSKTVIEEVYANHSNKLKGLANQARKELVHTKNPHYSPSAKTAYAKEVAALNSKLALAQRNAPRERQAQLIANALFKQKLQANPDMKEEKSELKKQKFLALKTARKRTGAKKELINITDSEWDAIQAGAISAHKLDQILDNTDLDRVKQLATPKSKVLMTNAKTQRAKAMEASGYTQSEIAKALGVSLTTLKNSLTDGGE